GLELGRLDDVTPAPDDNRVPALDRRPLEVCVRDLAGEEAKPVRRLVGPSLLAERTPLPTLERLEASGPFHSALFARTRRISACPTRSGSPATRRRASCSPRTRSHCSSAS